MYANCFKRALDLLIALIALVILSPVLLILIVVGAIAMRGNPFFTQYRPGKIDPKTGNERIFKLIKFRTMDNRRDENGHLLPDSVRLNGYGRFLRSTSLDELPELINILIGDMALVGPRPQLVRDMLFMTEAQRRRHTVRQGLTGLAQVSGRNNMTWEQKFEYDLQYIERITLWGDVKILFRTVTKVFRRDGIATEGMDTAEDLGDYLMRIGEVPAEEYDEKQRQANELLDVRG
ncbi:MAG: sugar transferase [Clostridia bacterium]|nr:sugar transferase [Clostridia bacterium]